LGLTYLLVAGNDTTAEVCPLPTAL